MFGFVNFIKTKLQITQVYLYYKIRLNYGVQTYLTTVYILAYWRSIYIGSFTIYTWILKKYVIYIYMHNFNRRSNTILFLYSSYSQIVNSHLPLPILEFYFDLYINLIGPKRLQSFIFLSFWNKSANIFNYYYYIFYIY